MGEKKIYGSPPAAGHLPKTQVRGRAGQLTWRGGAVPTGRPGCRPVTRAYLGFELFQKTVWRLAAARLQHRPKKEAQKNSIARGLARPGGDEGLLRVWIPAGFLGSTVHGILQARILEWLAFPLSRVSSQPRDRTPISHITGRFFTS